MKKFKYCKLCDTLQEIVKTEHGHVIITEPEVNTRWISLLPMLEKFKKLFSSLRLFYAKQNDDFPFTRNELDRIEDIILVLKPLEIAIKSVGKDDSNLIHADLEFTICYDLIPDTDIGKKMKKAFLSRIQERRNVTSDILFDLSGVEAKNMFFEKPTEEEKSQLYFKIFGQNTNSNSPDKRSTLEISLQKRRKDGIDEDSLESILRTIRPSSISCERAFSVCSRIVIPMRGNLSPQNLDMILFLYNNLEKVLVVDK